MNENDTNLQEQETVEGAEIAEVISDTPTMADEAAAVAGTDAPMPIAPAAPSAAPAPRGYAPRSHGQGGGASYGGRGRGGDSRGGPRGGGRGGPRREMRAKPEFDQKIIDIRRVTRVSSGGRRFSFAVSLVAGDRKGRIGVGTGKGGDTALAVEKAFRSARKNLITLNLTKSGSIAHDVKAKYSSARVEMSPAPGKGIAAGSSVRDVIELAGVKDIVAKLRSGTKNKLNNAQAAVLALSMVKKPRANSK
jgi:small subunit ribosomal protein S5